MAYSYLLDLYRVLGERQDEIRKTCDTSAVTEAEKQFQMGRLEASHDFFTFLKEQYHTKLPRRLQRE